MVPAARHPEDRRMHRILPVVISIAALSSAIAAQPAAAGTDTTPPIVAVPKDVTYQQKTRGAIVRMTYNVIVDDDLDPRPKVRCTPPSGSRFAVGTTKVTYTASDAAGNSTRASFRITVKKAR